VYLRKDSNMLKPKLQRKPRHQNDSTAPSNTPKLLRSIPKLTAKELLESIWATDKERSMDISVRTMKKIKAPKILEGYGCYRFTTYNRDNRHVHKVTLFFQDDVISYRSKVIVDSDTPRFLYYYEYALAKRGNAFIYRSNGEPPLRTNPSNKAGIDKHIYVCLRYIIRSHKK
jgi:hypothetical protein